MLADSEHCGGVRIRFASNAQYKQLVSVLDIMNRENIKKYWLGMRFETTTLYAFTYIQSRPINEPVYPGIHSPPYL